MCEYLAICDSTFAAVTSSCSWHVALGVGTLFFGPIIVIILAMLRLTLYIHKHHDELYEKRPTPPSLLQAYSLLRASQASEPPAKLLAAAVALLLLRRTRASCKFFRCSCCALTDAAHAALLHAKMAVPEGKGVGQQNAKYKVQGCVGQQNAKYKVDR